MVGESLDCLHAQLVDVEYRIVFLRLKDLYIPSESFRKVYGFLSREAAQFSCEHEGKTSQTVERFGFRDLLRPRR